MCTVRDRSSRVVNIKSGFKSTRISPFDGKIFKYDYAMSLITDLFFSNKEPSSPLNLMFSEGNK